jgi:carbon monoxide dehydrogenase subunit G
MSTVSRTFTVQPPPEVVVPYLADFANAEQWDPGTVSCTPQQRGPVQVGASWKNTSRIAGITSELIYTLTELTNERIVLVGRNKTATSIETIQVVAADGGSRITYTNDLTFNGAAKLAMLPAKLLFARLANETVHGIKTALNALS